MNFNLSMSACRQAFLPLFLIAVVCLLCYSNTFSVPFQFDDPDNISEMPFVRNIGVFFGPEWVSPGSTFVMRTVGFFTLAVNYRIHGEAVAGYHIVNILIHVFNGFLVYFLVLLTLRTPCLGSEKSDVGSERSEQTSKNPSLFTFHLSHLFPLAVALLFVCHPVQTQAVTYIVQRFSSLATLLYLLSLVLYIKWRLGQQESGVRRQETEVRSKKSAGNPLSAMRYALYALSLISAVLAMKTKEIAFTLPLVIALYEFMFFDGGLKKRMLYLVPLLLTMLIIPLSLMGSTKPLGEIIGDVSEATRVGTALPRWDYLFTQFRVIVTYIRLLFFPVSQNLDYDYPVYHSFLDPNVFLSFLFLLSIIGIGMWLAYRSWFMAHRKRLKANGAPDNELSAISCQRLIAFGIFWFFITLSVESSVIPIADVIFEHRLYLPSVGFFISATAVLHIAWERLKDKARWAGKAAAWGFVAGVFLLSGATYARNTVWQSELSLWKDVLRKSPDKVRANNNLGLAVMKQGDLAKAADFFTRAIAIGPNEAAPHYNLGRVYEKNGLYDKAIEEYKKAVSLKPDFADAYFDLGVAYASKGMRDEAIANYKKALGLKPDFARAHFNLGVIYLGKDLAKEAADELEAALRIEPTLDQARIFLEYARRMQRVK